MDERNPSNPEDAVEDVVARYERAFNDNDARAMNALFAEDTTFVNIGGNVVFGAQDLYRAQAFVFRPGGALRDISVRYDVESIGLLTPDVALAHARQRSAGSVPDGDKDEMESILTLVLIRARDGGWRIRAGQNTPVTGPPMRPDGSH